MESLITPGAFRGIAPSSRMPTLGWLMTGKPKRAPKRREFA